MGCGIEKATTGNDTATSVERLNATPKVSVLMLTMDRYQTIGRAIESVLAQSLEDWELIVVQDGNNQAVSSVIQEWEARDSRIRHVQRFKHGNIAEANNYGLRRTKGEFIAILDDDDYWSDPVKLERQVEFLESNPEYVGCGGGAVCIDTKGQETLRYIKPQEHEEIIGRALLANPMVHSTVLYRRSAAQQVGFYDESLAGFQDWDLFLKLGTVGKLYNFPEYFLAYQIWEGGGSFQSQKKNTQSALRIVRRHGDSYKGYLVALTMAYFYYWYAHMPVWVKRATFGFLSRTKKLIFSSNRTAAAVAASRESNY